MAEYSVQVAKVEDREEIYKILRDSFFPDMPIFAALNITKPPAIDTWPALQTLDQNLTLKAVTPEGEIVGVAINVIPREGIVVSIPGELGKFFDYIETDSKGLLTKLENTTMELRIMAIDKNWRGKGVSKRLVEKSENLAKKLGRNNIFGMATGAFMEASFKRHDWKCVYRLLYKDYANQNKNFTTPQEPHNSCTLYEKILS
ncbi:arylalkylamine N-acetyltransferase 1-like [Lycorma delicatula]|uniref:arylalkylamine N-acetyltransferase 1-like n=1 Tax=Lycorma delicatula TaxID=130591 RepID=UPI003F511FAF